MQEKTVEWGYSINKDNQIDYDRADIGLAMKARAAEPSLDVCIACGTCAATCSAGQFTSFNLRRLMLMLSIGRTKNLRKEIRKCMVCGKCQTICPRGVNTRGAILAIEKLLGAEGVIGV